jgi:hypothetical protein
MYAYDTTATAAKVSSIPSHRSTDDVCGAHRSPLQLKAQSSPSTSPWGIVTSLLLATSGSDCRLDKSCTMSWKTGHSGITRMSSARLNGAGPATTDICTACIPTLDSSTMYMRDAGVAFPLRYIAISSFATDFRWTRRSFLLQVQSTYS